MTKTTKRTLGLLGLLVAGLSVSSGSLATRLIGGLLGLISFFWIVDTERG